VKITRFVLFGVLGCAVLLLGQLQPGNYDIRFEPTAKLQSGAPIPYRIVVKDDLGKPLPHAEVTLRIETPDHHDPQAFRAPMTDPGVYTAKPQFPHSGQWNVTVHVTRLDRESEREITYTVPD
jgi:uncharacterized GH25 family protein